MLGAWQGGLRGFRLAKGASAVAWEENVQENMLPSLFANMLGHDDEIPMTTVSCPQPLPSAMGRA